MSSFLRLDTTAELYDLSFSCFERAQSLLPMRDAHGPFTRRLSPIGEAELKGLFEFLGLALDSEMSSITRRPRSTADESRPRAIRK